MKRITLALFGLLMLALCACNAGNNIMGNSGIKGNGNIVTKKVKVSDYNEIKIGQGINANEVSFSNRNKSPRFNYTQQQGSADLEITIDENLFPLLSIESSGNTLVIETKKGNVISPTRLEMNGHSKELTRLRISGGMDFFLQSNLTGDNLEIHASGASDVYLNNPVRISNLCKFTLSGASDLKASDLECDQIECRSSGSSDIKMSGKASTGEYRCSGSSDIKSYDFVVKRLNCSASGSSDIQTTVTEYLNASASGSSDIKYKGNPETTKRSSGSSDIDNVN